MTPVRSVKNQYVGINAHLHSFLQGAGEWSDFHLRHNAQLANSLTLPLREMNYFASNKLSLQLRRIEDDYPHMPRADVAIRDRQPYSRSGTATALQGALALRDIGELDDTAEFFYYAVAIYERLPDFQRGELVAWMELLSPSNKGKNEDAYTYVAKRRILMEQGVVFVEIDYLHETPATFGRIPAYPQDADARPYRIVVLDPRPIYRHTRVYLHEFNVDDPLPQVAIPLNGSDVLHFDFGLPYRLHFENAFYGDRIDYTAFPMNFNRYSPADQQRIANRMVAVLRTHKEGQDLEQAPFEPAALSLDEALQEIERLKTSSAV